MHVAVVGAGLIGLTTAYFLRQHGLEVTVVERDTGVGKETSYANGSILTPSLSDPWNAPGAVWKMIAQLGRENSPLLLRPRAIPSLCRWGIQFLKKTNEASFAKSSLANLKLSNYSMQVLAQLRDSIHLDYDGGALGTMLVCREQASLQQAVDSARRLAAFHLDYQVLSTDQIVAREPALAAIKEKLVGGIHYPDDEHGDSHKFSEGLAAAAASSGVHFLFAQRVEDFSRRNGKITALHTDRGSVAVDAVVVAAGSYSARLLRRLKIALPVQPGKGYSITVPISDWQNAPRMPVVDDHFHSVVTPLGNRIRVAGTAEFANFDTSISASRIENLKTLLTGLYPEAAQLDLSGDNNAWAGLRPVSADGSPILGKTPIANLYLNTGHGHLGWTMAAGSGKLVADLIAGETPDIDLSDYHLSRF